MKKIHYLVETARPKTLIASFAPILLIGAKYFTKVKEQPFLFFSLLISTVLIQILTNFYNDYFDLKQGLDTEERVGPKRPFQKGLLTTKEMRFSISILTIAYLGFVLPIILRIGLIGVALAFICYFLSVYYTKGSYSLTKLGVSDFFSFTFFGPIATGFSGFIFTQQFTMSDILLGCATGALSTTLLIVNHLRDEEEDRKNHKTTTVVRFGNHFGKSLIFFFMTMIKILPFILFQLTVVSFIGMFSSIVFAQLFLIAFFSCKTKEQYRDLMPKAALHFLLQTAVLFYLISTSPLRL
jgi:1,4-dihydroxy-2-naphthoate octaprenyltransferase